MYPSLSLALFSSHSNHCPPLAVSYSVSTWEIPYQTLQLQPRKENRVSPLQRGKRRWFRQGIHDWLMVLVGLIVALFHIAIEIGVNAHIYCSSIPHSTWTLCFQTLAAPPGRPDIRENRTLWAILHFNYISVTVCCFWLSSLLLVFSSLFLKILP